MTPLPQMTPLQEIAVLLDRQADLNLRIAQAVERLGDHQAAALGDFRREYDGKLEALSNRIEAAMRQRIDRVTGEVLS